MSSTDYKFQGWLAQDENSYKGNLVFKEFKPKSFEENDVDIQITHCGICASDVHTMSGGWGEKVYPMCVGHEIIGKVVRVGSKVEGGLKVGDRVGVGAQSGSCRTCGECHKCNESYCDNGLVGTYDGVYPNGDRSQGGYGDYARVPSHFAVKIPDNLPSEFAAPMMCGGVTVYSPLKRNGAGTTAKRVGIVGIGGLGHFGLMFAKALGAEVTAISHSAKKQEDAEKLGATHFINTHDEEWEKKNRRKLDLIVSTANGDDLPYSKFLELLAPGGKFVLVGAPDNGFVNNLNLWTLLMGGVFIGGSAIGSPEEIREMLQLAADKKIEPWIERYPMDKVSRVL